MSMQRFLEKLLDGVEVAWLTLGEVAYVSAAGVDKKSNEDEIPVKLLNFTDVYRNRYIDSSIPKMEVTAKVNKLESCNVLAGDIFITPSSEVKDDIGNSAVAVEDLQRVVYSYHIMRLRLKNPNMITSMFISYALGSDIVQKQINILAKGMTRFGLTKTQWENKLQIPIPCPDDPEKSLSIQAEIVRILDAFTALTTELTAELTAELIARKKQYNYYREQLLTFSDEEVEWKPLGELAKNLDSKRKPITSGLREAGEIPYYGASGIVDYVKDYIFDGDFLLVSEDGANLLARSTPIAFSISGKSWVNNHAHILEFETYAERRYVEYYLNSIDLTPYISGAAQPKLNKKNLNSIIIPNPLPEEQARIVSILDKFDALTNSIQEGLPREIELRQKQYEYYRDQLLNFPKSAEAAA